MITIHAAQASKHNHFRVHRDLIRKESKIFRYICSRVDFEKETEGVTNLPGVLAAVTDEFVLWLYTGSLFEPTGSAGEKSYQANWRLLVSTWIFGDIYEIPCFYRTRSQRRCSSAI